MPIIRCSEQKRQTLEEFYKSLIPDNVNSFADVGSPMLHVLTLINDTFKETAIYGLTSHASLILLNKDSSISPWYVAIRGIETAPNGQKNEYYIEYLMPADNQPWPAAKVTGGTTSLKELRKYMVIAMSECNGWTDSDELKTLNKELEAKK